MSASASPLPVDLARGQEALARGQWTEARACFEAALAEGESAEALEGLSACAYWLGDSRRSLEARERAYTLYVKAGQPGDAARVATWIGLTYIGGFGEKALTNGWLQRAHKLLEDLPPGPELAWLHLWEGHLALLYHGDAATARVKTERARELARTLGIADLRVMADALEGMQLVSEGRIAEGLLRLDGTTTAALAGEINLHAAGQACCYMLTACEQVWDYSRALQWCDRVSEYARRLQALSSITFCRRHYVASLLWRGEWERAEAEIQAMLREFEAVAPVYLPETWVRLAELRRRQGRCDEARALFLRHEGEPLSLLGRAAMLLDSPQADAEQASRLVERYFRQLPAHEVLARVPGLVLLVRARLALGERTAAGEARQELETVAAATKTEGLRAVAAAADALCAVHDKDLGRARDLLEDAIDLYRRSGSPFETARARLELAHVLRGSGREEEAQAEARTAREELDALGSMQEAARAAAFLEKIPTTSLPPEEARPVPGLSPRESEVLCLVAQGLSNPEIAEKLFLSEHTVKRHVANILAKLDLPSRTAAAAYAVRKGAL
jgi:DNA-binding NarL/FixJ family response regulator